MLFGQHFGGEPPRNLKYVFLTQFENGFNKTIGMFMFKNQNDGATLRILSAITEEEFIARNVSTTQTSNLFSVLEVMWALTFKNVWSFDRLVRLRSQWEDKIDTNRQL